MKDKDALMKYVKRQDPSINETDISGMFISKNNTSTSIFLLSKSEEDLRLDDCGGPEVSNAFKDIAKEWSGLLKNLQTYDSELITGMRKKLKGLDWADYWELYCRARHTQI